MSVMLQKKYVILIKHHNCIYRSCDCNNANVVFTITLSNYSYHSFNFINFNVDIFLLSMMYISIVCMISKLLMLLDAAAVRK